LICLFWVVSESPAVKVSPDVLSESSSVTMICEMQAGLPVNQCYFYIREEKNIKESWKCELELTGVEVLRWADVKSPASVNIYCFYEWDNKRSPHSSAATVMVRGERFHCCSSGLETITVKCLVTMDYFTSHRFT